jgi:hypothetical protein
VDGRVTRLEVKLSNTVLDVKSLIKEKEGTPIDSQRIIYDGRQLENEHTLSYCRVNNESTLHLVLTLRGGSGMFVYVKTCMDTLYPVCAMAC